MLSKVSNPPAGFDELTIKEKLDYVESLWDRITAKPEAIAVPDWHREVIEQRMREGQAGSHKARSWDDFSRRTSRQTTPAPIQAVTRRLTILRRASSALRFTLGPTFAKNAEFHSAPAPRGLGINLDATAPSLLPCCLRYDRQRNRRFYSARYTKPL